MSLGTAAVPLRGLIGGDGDEGEISVRSSGDEDTTPTYGKKRSRKRIRKDQETTGEEKRKLNEFMEQQKAFWEEVDEFDLVEEDVH